MLRSLDATALALAALLLFAGGPARAALTYYDSRLDFDSGNPGLAFEDFEEGTPETNFDSPLDSATNNAVFSPGEIAPGVSFSTDGSPGFDLRLQQLDTTLVLAPPSTLRRLVIDFSIPVRAVGLDVYQFNAAGDVSIEVSGQSGVLGSVSVPTSLAGAFFGVHSSSADITQIVIDDSDILPGIDDIEFGVPGALVLHYFGSRLAFDSAYPGLAVEDFEEGTPDTNFDSPLDSTTNNAVFSPGDILPGVSFSTDFSSSLDLRLRQLATTIVFSTPSSLRRLLIDFPGGAQAVGMDVFQFNAAGDVILETFGASGLLGTTRVETSQDGAFFGVESLGEPITQIRIDDTDILPGIDDVEFAPEPESLALAVAALAALAGAARLRTRAT